MTLWMTILSVLAIWALLAVLLVGLLLIWKVLESVRISLERIAMGVRAIETETHPLGERSGTLTEHIGRTGRGVNGLAQGLARVNDDLAGAAPALKSNR